MDFGEALKLLKKGAAIKRPVWDYKIAIREEPGVRETFPDIRVPTLFIVKLGSSEHGFRYHPFDEDLLAEDWEQVDE
jgi:hypothetical protein